MLYKNNSILIINKEMNMTSFDVIRNIRKILNIKKIGHGGTLDPNAKGVLPIFLGKATKISNFIQKEFKEYICKLELGKRSDTLDIWGNISTCSYEKIEYKKIQEVFNSFIGVMDQKTPMYSARKINGKKLYEYAREGKIISTPAREIEIKNIDILKISLPYIEFKIECSKGTYIRSVCDDIGKKLGTNAIMVDLVRTKVGNFYIENSIKIAEVEKLYNDNTIDKYLISIDEYFEHMKKVKIQSKLSRLLHNGNKIDINYISNIDTSDSNYYRVYDDNKTFMGIYLLENNYLVPKLFMGI